MPKIKFYHIKTLLWTYLVWAAINLWLAFSFCKPMGYQITLTRVSYYWAVLHIAPLIAFIGTLWHADIGSFILLAVPPVVAGFAVIAGLLKKGRWARFLVIIGMSIWFFWAFCILGMGV